MKPSEEKLVNHLKSRGHHFPDDFNFDDENFVDHVCDHHLKYGFDSRTAVKQAAGYALSGAENLFLEIAKKFERRGHSDKKMMAILIKGTPGVFEDEKGPHVVLPFSFTDPRYGHNFVKYIADRPKDYGFENFKQVYLAAKVLPWDRPSEDGAYLYKDESGNTPWTPVKDDFGVLDKWVGFEFLPSGEVKTFGPGSGTGSPKEAEKVCTCDLQTVLMVTGCKCGASK